MFTYTHANTPVGQSERAYYLSYFINMCRVLLAGSSNSGWVDSFLKIIGLEDLIDTEYSKLGKLVTVHT